jgi:syntaxin 7
MNQTSGYGGQYYAGHQDEHDEHASLIEAERQQQFAQLTSDVEAQHAQIAYRDQAIRSLQRDMSEVHDMFKDLANLVSEQGHMVDDIESNVTAASNDVDIGHSEVNKAHEYQKKGRNKLCIAAIIISILAAIAVLIVVVVVMTRPKKD